MTARAAAWLGPDTTDSTPHRRPRLVVLRARGLGDMLTAVPALRALARAFPEHTRVLLAPHTLRGLIELVTLHGEPVVDRVTPFAGLDAPVPAEYGPDIAINLHGRGPRSHRVLRALHPRRLLAFGCPAEGVPGPRWPGDEHDVRRWSALLAHDGIPVDPGDLAIDVPPTSWAVPGATVVHPGAASPARRWPPSRWAEVAAQERRGGRRVLVTGSATERPIAMAVAREAGLPEGDVLAGRTGLRDLVGVVARAGRLVCGDTGIAHVATAVGAPSVVLFGPAAPAQCGPPPERPQHVSLWAGHHGDPQASTPDPGLLRITVGDVLTALDLLPVQRVRQLG